MKNSIFEKSHLMKFIQLTLISLFLFLFSHFGFSQDQIIDSLLDVAQNAKHDTTRIKIYIHIGDLFEFDIPDTAATYYKKARALAHKHVQDSIDISEKIWYRFLSLENTALRYQGILYYRKGDYSNAIDYFEKTLQVSKMLSESSIEEYAMDGINGMSMCYTNIGIIHNSQNNHEYAIDYYNKALEIYDKLDNKLGISQCYTNIGNVRFGQEKYDEAIEYYEKSIDISEEIGDNNGLLGCYNNIGAIHIELGNYTEAIDYFEKALKIAEELGVTSSMAIINGNIASIHIEINDSTKTLTEPERIYHYNQAVKYASKAMDIAVDINAPIRIYWAANYLKQAYKGLGNYEKAYEYSEIFTDMKDTLFSNEKTEAMAEMTAKYETEKKQFQIEKMEKEKELDALVISKQKLVNDRQKTIIISFIIGVIIILVFSVFLYRLFLQKRKANALLKYQNNEINQQKEEIEAQRDEIESQRDEVQFQKGEIEDSILYAKRIQTAVIPSMEKFESFFKSHFVIFKPHSVVSGDFYWITQVNEWIIATVVDCTGHGVPGAFMSMLGVSFLNEIVRKKEVTNAASVLNHLRDSVIEALQQSNSDTNDVRDGMDMSLVAIHEGRKKAFWAGANNPLWIVRHSETEKQLDDIANKVEVIKGDAMPVSIFMNMRDFTNHEITLNEKDRLYLFSDGFSDQFGGPKGKKYLNKSFRRLIAETSILPMKEQGKHVEIAFDEWGTYGGKIFEQVDDVTVLGLEI